MNKQIRKYRSCKYGGILGHGGYDSDFSDDETGEKADKQKNRNEDALLKKPFQKEKQSQVAHRQVATDEWDREEARNRRFHLIAMDAYARHKKFVNDYILYYGGKKEDFRRSGDNDKTDLDIIRENHRFLWREEDEADMNWEKRLSKKYYDKLFKEYCIADLSKYKENKFGFRWRHEKEVVSGKGLCPECSYKLNFHHRRKEVKPTKKRKSTEESSKMLNCKKSRLSTPHQQKSKKKKSHKDQTSSQESDTSDADSDKSFQQDGPSDAEFWKGPPQDTEEKTREEEFDEYFQDLFL
ncbi:protein FRA10AC1 isoform X3 [Sceloporus undulatus]|uniref:protein FRA10AC1 isoform X3 n=1 Tax=Sceloporus undulatus TaxID=8520 RepID=UPI001C4C949F|nr:protein FRA10AC1 isoform X3 [Sceloporus undulatus]